MTLPEVDHSPQRKNELVGFPLITRLFFAGILTLVGLIAWIVPHSEGLLVSFAENKAWAPYSSPTPEPGSNTPFGAIFTQAKGGKLAQDAVLSRGNHLLPEIALTFDDGPSPYYTLQVLHILKHYRIKATFFCIGRQVAFFPQIVKEEYSEGNVIGDHTWSHPLLPLLAAPQIFSQIAMTDEIVQQIIGVRPAFFRPPYGGLDADVLAQANRLNLITTLWSLDPEDWSLPGTPAIISRVLSAAGDGSIILMHDGGGNRAETVAALPTIIETLQKRGFHFVTLPQLVSDLEDITDSHGKVDKEVGVTASSFVEQFVATVKEIGSGVLRRPLENVDECFQKFRY